MYIEIYIKFYIISIIFYLQFCKLVFFNLIYFFYADKYASISSFLKTL